MTIIAGLGNPGKEHAHSRHNAGFMVLDALAVSFGHTTWKSHGKCPALYIKQKDCLLCKPQTYMNNSGIGVACILSYFSVSPSGLWVVSDDIDLPSGTVRVRIGGGSAGHKGVQSVIDHIGSSDFVRFRMGVGRGLAENNVHTGEEKTDAVVRHVLSPFTREEMAVVGKSIGTAVSLLDRALCEGIDSIVT